ncbi:hypothetical protein FHT44_004912 [Mycolicibacterium sp. BK634]|uniref:hypothetical protein n=1 Tax=Mycolicibacterium sp. BK634 TaxID=2587099 RepID=UPI00161556D6|nr:hypothetical protein [Mycolicibacterium sp. BK634]MBB3752400.1 hypothetical protein [Mycolicibacterium sp. BK634]
MTVCPEIYAVDLTDFEFAKPCAYDECPRSAEWVIWVLHAEDCKPATYFVCEGCKTETEQAWIECLTEPHLCPDCLEPYIGNLGDYFRAVKL